VLAGGNAASGNHHLPNRVSASMAREMILAGTAPDGLWVDGILEFYQQPHFTHLPANLYCQHLSIAQCPNITTLSDSLHCHKFSISDCPNLAALPAGLHCKDLTIENCPNLTSLPDDLGCQCLTIENCPNLIALPTDLQCQYLHIKDCPNLIALPAGLHLNSLYITNCPSLTVLPNDMTIHGTIWLDACQQFYHLPNNLNVENLTIHDCPELYRLPNGLHCNNVEIVDCPNLSNLPAGLVCYGLKAQNLPLTALPGDLSVQHRLDLSGCTRLQVLPLGLRVASLLLRDCVALTALPEGLDVAFLDISGCAGLRAFPAQGRIGIGHLLARGCNNLRALPGWLAPLANLDLAGCQQISALPAGLRLSGWLDVAGTALTAATVPAHLHTRLRWRGVPIEPRIAFEPETITGAEVLACENVELRRVLMERMGFERFLGQVEAKLLDQDHDAGGERKLLQVPLPDDEPVVVMAVSCPSTGHHYMLRVPPTTKTCHQAAAWLAGFDNPNDYQPLVEA
jgi:hypothetical protein